MKRIYFNGRSIKRINNQRHLAQQVKRSNHQINANWTRQQREAEEERMNKALLPTITDNKAAIRHKEIEEALKKLSKKHYSIIVEFSDYQAIEDFCKYITENPDSIKDTTPREIAQMYLDFKENRKVKA